MAFIPSQLNDCPTALYRLFDAAGDLLYVGITNNVKVRMQGHRADKRWWPEVVEKRITWYPNRPDAAAAEDRAIKTEDPRYDRSYRQAGGANLPIRQPRPAAPRVAQDDSTESEPNWARMLRTAPVYVRQVVPVRGNRSA